MRLDPTQLLLDGRTHAEVVHATALGALEEPASIADLAAALHPHIGKPSSWTHGDYPRRELAATWGIVRRMERLGLVELSCGPLSHRRQPGVVVRRAPPSKRSAPAAAPGFVLSLSPTADPSQATA